MTADFLREKFLSFFKERKHKIVESDSLVPKDDPTVLFTPAGMNQFKKEFMGFDSGFKRAATAQRCLRTDDLEKVGKTSSHHTFFEMLGNFSFGDYFKKEAIAWAWEFLTKELKIDQQKLWVSVYKEDDEAYAIWKDAVGVPEQKIVRLGDKDNFWPAEAKTKGPNGPCGPCSEIFFDFGLDTGCGKKECDPSCSCGRFVEIWNLVFTQFNRKDDATLEPLPNKNIDTGMGLERLTAVMQGKRNNFETELFLPIIEKIKASSVENPDEKIVYAVADHIRAVVFAIFDGILPSNEGRGYIVRKIIRKSVLHLRSLGIKEPFFYHLVSVVIEIMHVPYPELAEHREEIAQIVLSEEKNFIHTLNTAPEIYKNVFTPYFGKPITRVDAIDVSKIIFTLYDARGIPLDLTKNWLDSQKIKYSQTAIEEQLNMQRDRSRAKSQMKGDVFAAKGIGINVQATRFLGYSNESAQAKVLVLLKEGKEINKVVQAEEARIVLDQTPFYAESGGQVGDSGEIFLGKNIFEVKDTQKINGIFLHSGRVKSGSFSKEDTVTARVDSRRRKNIAINHTATHILQAALRKILGSNVKQQGSLVEPERLRFDFTHFKALSEEEILRVEEVANGYIKNNYAVSVAEMPIKEAKHAGALAFFEEKYSQIVRVVSIADISKELCAGTHLSRIADIGLIKITSESSIASGIRRIEAVTGDSARQFISEQAKINAKESERKNRLEEKKKEEKKLQVQMENEALKRLPLALEKSQKTKDVSVIFSLEDGLDMFGLRLLADKIKEKLNKAIIVLGSEESELNKVYLVIAISGDLGKEADAQGLIRQVAEVIGGSGGGRKDFAQAGGVKPGNLKLAFEKLRDIINGLL